MKTLTETFNILWNVGLDVYRKDLLVQTEGIVELLFNQHLPIQMNDLSYLKEVETGKKPEGYDLFNKSFMVVKDGENFYFEHDGKAYTNKIVCFVPNKHK